jgi:hypothetical protein
MLGVGIDHDPISYLGVIATRRKAHKPNLPDFGDIAREVPSSF